jgi:hypothetical protein
VVQRAGNLRSCNPMMKSIPKRGTFERDKAQRTKSRPIAIHNAGPNQRQWTPSTVQRGLSVSLED